MLKIKEYNEEKLKEIIKYKFNESNESEAFMTHINGDDKVIKLFKEKINIEEKTQKLNLLSDKLEEINNVSKPDFLISNGENITGYAMPYIKGNKFHSLDYKKQDQIIILKKLSLLIKKLHNKGIIVPDFINNIIVDKHLNVSLIDIDSFVFDEFKVDNPNVYYWQYVRNTKGFNMMFDDYLLNILTIATLNKISPAYIYGVYEDNHSKFDVKDKEINEIIQNTLNLNGIYNEHNIVDLIDPYNKKDMKKLRHKIF